MRSLRRFLIFVLVAGGLVIGFRAASLAQSGTSSPSMPLVVRVFYLHDMDAREASTLVRTHIPVRALAQLDDRDALVVADIAEKVDQCENILRQLRVVDRAVEPHKPLELDRMAQSPPATRIFYLARTYDQVILRTIYQIQDVKQLPEGNGVSVSAAQPVLDAGEALLRELGLLVESTKRSGGS
jgi:hypothetical protein